MLRQILCLSFGDRVTRGLYSEFTLSTPVQAWKRTTERLKGCEVRTITKLTLLLLYLYSFAQAVLWCYEKSVQVIPYIADLLFKNNMQTFRKVLFSPQDKKGISCFMVNTFYKEK
jgi:hypothetical protein